jgi:hypothetical protein
MSTNSSGRSGQQRNGHPTIARKAAATTTGAEDAEPTGYPTADRYRAETVHTRETDDHTKIKEDNDQN